MGRSQAHRLVLHDGNPIKPQRLAHHVDQLGDTGRPNISAQAQVSDKTGTFLGRQARTGSNRHKLFISGDRIDREAERLGKLRDLPRIGRGHGLQPISHVIDIL